MTQFTATIIGKLWTVLYQSFDCVIPNSFDPVSDQVQKSGLAPVAVASGRWGTSATLTAVHCKDVSLGPYHNSAWLILLPG